MDEGEAHRNVGVPGVGPLGALQELKSARDVLAEIAMLAETVERLRMFRRRDQHLIPGAGGVIQPALGHELLGCLDQHSDAYVDRGALQRPQTL